MNVSILFMRGLLAELRQRGVSETDLLSGTGLSVAELHDIQFHASVEALERLGRNAVALTGDPGIGLTVGTNAPHKALQVLGHLLMACRTPRDALNAYLVHAPWIASGGEWELHEEAENATLYYHRTGLPDDCSRMIIDGVISALVAFGRSFAPGKDPIEVRFRHAEPSYAERYAAVFRCPVHFGSPRNAIVFARAVLERTQLYADETMVAEFHDTVTRLLHRSGGGEVTERVRLLLRAHDDLGAVYVAEYARRFGVSERTLRNWLGQEGGTFSQLVDQERCRRAAFELRKKGASISEIAQRVGFTERSAFHRAFKRWTGMTPAEYMASYDR